MGNIFRVSNISQLKAREIIAKYEKREKDLPILHKVPQYNYFIVKGLLK